jgi:uncharacterized protein (DUF885 family)
LPQQKPEEGDVMLSDIRQASTAVVMLVLLAISPRATAAQSPVAGETADLREMIQRFSEDQRGLLRTYRVLTSDSRLERLTKFYDDTLASLKRVDFDGLNQDGKIDYVEFQHYLNHRLHGLALDSQQYAEMAPVIPFAKTIAEMEDARRRMQTPDGQHCAAALATMVKELAQLKRAEEAGLAEGDKAKGTSGNGIAPIRAKRTVARRAARTTKDLRESLREWYRTYSGYDPNFTWWVDEPYKEADKALEGYETFLTERLVGIKADDKTTIIGDPIGREALLIELSDAMIPYTPEELLAVAKREMAWCTTEMVKASNEMGYGDDWHKALEHVKEMHVAPGEQPEWIRKLAWEAIDYVEKHDLVTVPALAKETWRMEMMSPERQLVNPFFTGGEVISVSYPTDTMTYEQRMMSMRGNNIPFARATVFHELIPGHRLQAYMSERYRSYRRIFETPFWAEGNALYWELLLWDMGFARTPEEKVGMLFWRMHRCARIIFSLSFHLGLMTQEQCVDFLVKSVGHEPDNATAEVRRSFDGSYGPLYQAAYMLGALQFWALRKETVTTGRMTIREYDDAILQENAIPVEMLRAKLLNLPLTRDYQATWKFYAANPAIE